MRNTDYSNTIFYKIYCKVPEITDVYIGHTTNFVKRKTEHEQSCNHEKSASHKFKVYKFIREHGGWNNWKMEILGFKCCSNLREACEEEQRYYDEYIATLNTNLPIKVIGIQKVADKNAIEVCDDNKPYKFTCEKCKYKSSSKKEYKNHLLSAKHLENFKNDKKHYICKTCDFICYKKSSYDRHVSTKKHKDAISGGKKALEYKCDYCNYTCRYKSEYDKHISSMKHKNKVNTTDYEKQNTQYYCKECDYTCQYSSLFEKHKNTSKHINKGSVSSASATAHLSYNIDNNDNTHLAKIMEHHSKQTEELKNFIIHHSEIHQQQTKEHQQQLKEHQEQNNKQLQEIMDIIKQATAINN